jgi:hypothetical protein
MKILIGCEFSGRVRDAFSIEHDVISCDFLPTEAAGKHYQGNVLDLLNERWDMFIGFPDCTYRCNSGIRWLKNNPKRQLELRKADLFFNILLNVDIPKICIENPIPHKYSNIPKYSQIIHPWMFGDNEQKATCLWLKGLPKLLPDIKVKPENTKQSIHNMPPGINRGHIRSITFQGIANAMANQWG